jgi:hypothetical protein
VQVRKKPRRLVENGANVETSAGDNLCKKPTMGLDLISCPKGTAKGKPKAEAKEGFVKKVGPAWVRQLPILG